MPAPARKPGPAFLRDYKKIILVQYVLHEHRCGRVQAEFTSTTLDKAYKHW
jgi:hypothetical protein